jgi:hypothetical protein
MKNSVFLILAVAFCSTVSAQEVKILKGDIKPLRGQAIIKTEFVYDSMIVGNSNVAEKDFIAYRKTRLNETGANGDLWEKYWVDNRAERYEPEFRALFAKYSGISTLGDEKTPYTLIFKTKHTEPGFYDGGTLPPSIDGEAWIVETAAPTHVIAKISVMRSPGLQAGYARAGRSLGKLFKKELQ